MEREKPLRIGTKTKWGIIKAVGYVGERYYWIVDKDKNVAMMPACVIETKNLSIESKL